MNIWIPRFFQILNYFNLKTKPRAQEAFFFFVLSLVPPLTSSCDWLPWPSAAIAWRSCHSRAGQPHCKMFGKWKWRRRKTDRKPIATGWWKKKITSTPGRRDTPWGDGGGRETWEVTLFWGVCLFVCVGGDQREAVRQAGRQAWAVKPRQQQKQQRD